MKTQTIIFAVEEQNGLFDFEYFNCPVGKDPKEEFFASRLIQSIKGFKRPMPKSFEIEDILIHA